jgi:hypothetical protein
MALTHTTLVRTVFGDKRVVITESTLDNSYITNGEPLTAAEFGLASIEAIIATPANNDGYVPSWDRTNSKLIMLYGDNNNAADGPLIEVPNTTDLSAVQVTLQVIGK